MSLQILMNSRQSPRAARGDRGPQDHDNSNRINGAVNITAAAGEGHLRQDQRTVENWMMQVALLQEQDRQQREAAQQFVQTQQQSNVPASDGSGFKMSSKNCSDAVHQYHKMLLEEQARRNREQREQQ